MKTRLLIVGVTCTLVASVATHIIDRGVFRVQADEPYYKIPGDVNGDHRINLGDAIYILNYLFSFGPEPVACEPCPSPPPPMLPATGQATCYDAAGNVIDCSSTQFPSQDGFYRAGCPTENRYVDNGDATVTDNCTGLMWQKETADLNGDGHIDRDHDQMSWSEALKYCGSLELAAHDDWRLPNIRELLSIVSYERLGFTIDPIFVASASWYWSSTTEAHQPVYAWSVSFWRGYAGDGAKTGGYYVRAVRTAQ